MQKRTCRECRAVVLMVMILCAAGCAGPQGEPWHERQWETRGPQTEPQRPYIPEEVDSPFEVRDFVYMEEAPRPTRGEPDEAQEVSALDEAVEAESPGITDPTPAAADEHIERTADGKRPMARPVFPGVRVMVDQRMVEVDAAVLWPPEVLEQVACTPGSREHEALLVVHAQPSHIHAALLMAGLEPGHPGVWRQGLEGVQLSPPKGDEVEVLVKHERGGAAGEQIIEPIARWIVDAQSGESPDDLTFVFGGSTIRKNLAWMDDPDGEHYVADMTGSVVGLVTFGDEMVGLKRVLSEHEAHRPHEWIADIERMPADGTSVVLVLRGRQEQP